MQTAPTLFISGTNSATFIKVEGTFIDTDASGTDAATATNPGGNTSEFSAPRVVVALYR
jgi:hypothetical protein